MKREREFRADYRRSPLFFLLAIPAGGVYSELGGQPVRPKPRKQKSARPKPKARRPTHRAARLAPSAVPEVNPREETVLTDLPFSYGETKLVLMVRDPYWAYSYWDFSGETWNGVQARLGEDPSLKPVMRIHDLRAKKFYSLLVSLEAKNWYLHLGTPDCRYFAELGIGDGSHRFHLIARSNEVQTPRDKPSEVVDPEWSDRDFDEIYRLSGGGSPGLSSPGSLFFPRTA